MFDVQREHFNEPNAVALGAIFYSRVLLSRDGVGRLPSMGRKTTRNVFVCLPMNRLDHRCLQNVAMSRPLTIIRIKDHG